MGEAGTKYVDYMPEKIHQLKLHSGLVTGY